jgi:hypothetical protein
LKLLFRRCANLRMAVASAPAGAPAFTLRLIARRFLTLTSEIDELTTSIPAAIRTRTGHLLQRYGVGHRWRLCRHRIVIEQMPTFLSSGGWVTGRHWIWIPGRAPHRYR